MRKPRKHKGGLVEMTALLEGALQTLGVKGDFEKVKVEQMCREVLGKNFSKALTAVTLKKRVVELAFNHSIWMQEANFRREEVLRKLQTEFPKIGIKDLTLTLSRSSKR